MTDTLYDLFFSGKTTGDKEPDQVRLEVGKIFSVDNETLDRLFSGKPIRIKSGVDQDTAIKYRVALREAGALLDIKPQKSDVNEASPTKDLRHSDVLTLLPANTGNLIDCAVPADPLPLPDISGIGLAPAGVVLDESDSPTAKIIDTGELTLSEPNTGSLEDCQPIVQARPIPDITHIELTPDQPVSRVADHSDN